MEKIWKNVILPIVVILLGTLLYRLVASLKGLSILPISFLLVVIRAATLFAFGMILKSFKKKRSSGWVGKLIISFVLFFYILLECGYLNGFGQLIYILGLIGLTNESIAIPLIYVLCGYLFFM